MTHIHTKDLQETLESFGMLLTKLGESAEIRQMCEAPFAIGLQLGEDSVCVAITDRLNYTATAWLSDKGRLVFSWKCAGCGNITESNEIGDCCEDCANVVADNYKESVEGAYRGAIGY
jgi:hypothetical protein